MSQPIEETLEVPAAPQTTLDQDLELANTTPSKKDEVDPYLVVFVEPFDEDNPKCWSTGKKWTVTDVLSATSFNRIMLSTIMAPALPIIAKELDMRATEAVMALSSYMLATAFGPLMLGPLSEVYGRVPIMYLSNLWFLAFNLLCGFAHSKGLLIASRFLAGFGASAIYSLAGGVMGDIWRSEQRGRTLGIYALIPVLGAAVGPVLGGFIAGRASWRWIFWSTSALQGVMIIASYLAFHESFAPVILHRRAAKLRKETGDHRYYTLGERRIADRTLPSILWTNLSRPLRLLACNPIIQICACLSGLTYGLLYIVLTTLSKLYISAYGESVEISGLHYFAPSLGEIVGSLVSGPLVDSIYKRLKRRRGEGEGQPEYHLPLLFPGGIVAAAGFLIYGWTAHYHVFWFVVDFGVFLNCFGMQTGGIPVQSYVIESFPDHVGSATAASQFVRSLTAFAFPLFAPQLYQSLEYGWGNALIGALLLVITAPAPFLIWKYGPRLRATARSSY